MAPITFTRYGITPVDLIWPVAATFIFLYLLVKCSRRTFMLAESAHLFFLSTCIFIQPTRLLQYLAIGTPETTHIYSYRALGAVILSIAVLLYLTRDSADNTVPVSIITSRIVVNLCHLSYIVKMLYFHNPNDKDKSNTFNASIMAISLYGTLMMTMCYLCLLFRSEYYAGYSQRSTRVNLHLRLDFFYCILLGSAMYGCPNLIYDIFIGFGQPDSLHFGIIQFTGSFLLGSAFQSLEATGYMYYEDKKHLFHSRAVGAIGVLMVMTFTFLVSVWQPRQLLIITPPLLVSLANSLLACKSIDDFLVAANIKIK